MLPRAYHDLLDRWEDLEKELTAAARLCFSCGEKGPDNRDWRTPGPTQYVTVCPACSASSHSTYAGHLHGSLYASLRSTHRATDYLCRLCKSSPASVWDHCHEHGYVRGPLCARCNGAEGSGRHFLDQDGSVSHLLQCPACHRERTLPRRYQTALAAAHLEATEGHEGCIDRPYIQRPILIDDGSTRFAIRCHTHTHKWTRELSPAEIADLVRDFLKSQ
ncbi:endonuclease domain-containing protein [Streptomyces sp. H39-C1]|uniref:endonuclease domain-containing protein n=1 Tax=Streptomyces sp. H39-C1 TaxID=3004355 RepID=UPI003FA78617